MSEGMRRDAPARGDLQLYLTGEHDCSYIDGLQARTLFVDPLARIDGERAEWLQQIGFRRSGQHFYRPACRGCQRCVPVRVPVADSAEPLAAAQPARATTATSGSPPPARLELEHYASTSAICCTATATATWPTTSPSRPTPASCSRPGAARPAFSRCAATAACSASP
jgi:hypothetical protein